MSKKIIIRRVENGCNLFEPETHSVGATIQSDSGPCIMTFPEHKKDELGNFNAAARSAFEEYLKVKDLTPKPKRKPYNGKIFVVKYPGNALKSRKIYQVRNGCIQPATIARSPYIFEDMDDAEMSWAIHTTIYDRYAPYDVSTSNMTRAYFVNE